MTTQNVDIIKTNIFFGGIALIDVKDLVKQYGTNRAVNGISFTVEKGKIYGLLGPNGAGKSTTMNIITGCLAATSGSVTVDGHDIFEEPIEAKRLIGYLPEMPPLYMDMTPVEYLTFVAEAKGLRGFDVTGQVSEVIEVTGLEEYKNKLIKNLSKGYKQRVGIAQAMLGNPEVIILDEPTVGLDPKQILEIRDLIRRLGQTKTVILSSHILAEISAVCEHIMIISRGTLVANDTLENLEAIANKSNKLLISVRGELNKILEKLTSLDGVISAEGEEKDGISTVRLELEKEGDYRDGIFFAMSENKTPILSMDYEETTLEDIFLAMTEDDVYPDENGNLPSIEEILSRRGKTVEEDVTEDIEDETSDIEGPDNSDEEYTPLFSTEQKEEDAE